MRSLGAEMAEYKPKRVDVRSKRADFGYARADWAAAPKGPMTYAFTWGEISPPSPSSAYPPGLNPGFEAQFPVSRIISQS